MSLKSFFHLTRIEVGLDEVGRGCLAGPVVSAAVILPKDFDFPIVKDSKKLSEKKRKEAFELIKEKALAYSISFVPPQTIDKINILQATMESMHNCLDTIGMDYEHILVDGNYFTQYKDKIHTCVIKGDNTYYSIAAASILAKVSRDEYMKELHKQFPQYKWDGNKGYGSSEHIEVIKNLGITEHHRKSFLKNILQS
jgi:ribonuclease HII